MNIIPFVLTILLILSYSLAASFQGRLLSYRNQKAYVAMRGAEMNILRRCELEQFKMLPGDIVKKEKKQSLKKSKQAASPKIEELEINPPCAKLNLYPLIVEGRDAHAALYETAAKTLRLFYAEHGFSGKKRFEYVLLDAILAGAKAKIKSEVRLALETIALKDEALQPLYYTLLKGTKRYQLSGTGFPPLVDYWKIEKEAGKICLFHCHPDMLTVFFGQKTTPKLYEELHDSSKKAAMTLDAILAWSSDPQLRFVDQAVWDLIDFKRPQHGESPVKTMLAEEDGALIRKNIATHKNRS